MYLFLSMMPIYKYCLFIFFVFNCGFALTPKANITIPLKTNTEVLRLNLPYGETHNNVYGLNIGLFNFIRNDLIGVQIGIINYCPNNTISIMLVENYCSSPSSQPEQKTETQPESTKQTFKN